MTRELINKKEIDGPYWYLFYGDSGADGGVYAHDDDEALQRYARGIGRPVSWVVKHYGYEALHVSPRTESEEQVRRALSGVSQVRKDPTDIKLS